MKKLEIEFNPSPSTQNQVQYNSQTQISNNSYETSNSSISMTSSSSRGSQTPNSPQTPPTSKKSLSNPIDDNDEYYASDTIDGNYENYGNYTNNTNNRNKPPQKFIPFDPESTTHYFAGITSSLDIPSLSSRQQLNDEAQKSATPAKQENSLSEKKSQKSSDSTFEYFPLTRKLSQSSESTKQTESLNSKNSPKSSDPTFQYFPSTRTSSQSSYSSNLSTPSLPSSPPISKFTNLPSPSTQSPYPNGSLRRASSSMSTQSDSSSSDADFFASLSSLSVIDVDRTKQYVVERVPYCKRKLMKLTYTERREALITRICSIVHQVEPQYATRITELLMELTLDTLVVVLGCFFFFF